MCSGDVLLLLASTVKWELVKLNVRFGSIFKKWKVQLKKKIYIYLIKFILKAYNLKRKKKSLVGKYL